MNVQLVLADERTRVELLEGVDPYHRSLRRTILDQSIADGREWLVMRLQDHQPAPGQMRKWRAGRLVADGAKERPYAERWLEDVATAFRRALRARRDASVFQRHHP
jgi:hypothetical protein